MEKTIEHIRKERVDVAGNEMWFPMMLQYFIQSPYGKRHKLKNFEDLIKHLKRRKALEHKIMKEVMHGQALVIEGKNYEIEKKKLKPFGKPIKPTQ